jgi:hypothetical protein
MEAVRQAVADADASNAQPISIHVTSITSYDFGDIMAMKGRLT